MMLRNEFPTEFGLPMKPLFVGTGAESAQLVTNFVTLFTVSGTGVKVTRNWQPLDIRPGGGLALHKLE